MPFVTANRARLWYGERGSGAAPAVLLIHGGLLEPMDGARFWIAPGIAEGLVAEGFRVLIPDRRFSGGRTVAPIDVHTWDVEAEDIRTVLDASDAEAAHVVSGSNGISAAMRFALTSPDRMRSLTLCWPSPPDNQRAHDLFNETHSLLSSVGPAGYVDAIRATTGSGSQSPLLFRHVLASDSAVADDFAKLPVDEAVRIVTATEQHLLAGDVLRGVSSRDIEWLDASRLPIAVMPADPEDRAHSRVIADRLASGIRGSTLLAGTPVSPSPLFPAHRDAFVNVLIQRFNAIPSTPA